MIHYYYKRDHGRAFGNPFVGDLERKKASA